MTAASARPDAPTVSEAQQRILARAPRVAGERIPVEQALGRVLAESPTAKLTLPQRDVSVMDGWAVRSTDLTGEHRHVSLARWGESAAGHPLDETLPIRGAARISTGAVLPPGADAVVPQEDTHTRDGRVTIDLTSSGPIEPGKFVRAAGSDVQAGEPLLPVGHTLAPGDLALLAGTGTPRISVARPPTVAILCTGDELVAIGNTPGPGQVISTNGLMLAAQAHEAGARPELLPDVGDSPKRLTDALQRGLAYDVLVTSGGISVGKHDHVHAGLTRIGCEIDVHTVRLRPGKPTTFGVTGRTLVFALPGNPASSWVAFELFVRPALRAMMGAPTQRSIQRVELAEDVRGAGSRAHYVRARLQGNRAHPLPQQTSGNLRSISAFDVLLAVPEGVERLQAGQTVDALVVSTP